MDENKFWVLVVAIITAGIVCFSCGIYGINTYKVTKMAAQGYEETAYPGGHYTYFHKVK